jgi:hypothetical protein
VIKAERFYELMVLGCSQIRVLFYERSWLFWKNQVGYDDIHRNSNDSVPEFVGRAHRMGMKKVRDLLTNIQERRELEKATKNKAFKTIDFIKKMGIPD